MRLIYAKIVKTLEHETKMEKEKFSLYQTQIQTYVGFTSFMTAVGVFFVGILLSTFKSYDIDIKVPISFLIISTFGFLFSTLIYTSIAQEISEKREKHLQYLFFLGDAISEYLGIYFLIVSIPLAVGLITKDGFLETIAIVAAVVGLSIYQFSHASMVERHFQDKHKPLSWAMIILVLLLFLSQIFDFYFVEFAILFVTLMVYTTYRASTEYLY